MTANPSIDPARLLSEHLDEVFAALKETDGEWKSGHEDITEMFEVLGIPYEVTIEKRPIRGRVRAVIDAYVRRDDLTVVVRWMPSFQQLIDQVEAGG